MRRVTSRIFIAHRGGAGAAAGTATGPSFTGFVASVLGGQPDLALTVVNSVVQQVAGPVGRSLEAMEYALGALGPVNAGFGWNDNGQVVVPYAQRVGLETFETYPPGPVGAGDLTQGEGWNGGTVLFAW